MKRFKSLLVLALGIVGVLAMATGAGAGSVSPELMNLAPGTVVPEAGVGSPSGARPGQVPADVFDFPSADSAVVGSVGFIDGEQVGYFWSVSRGDSVTEVFSGPASITAYSLDVDVIENVLNSGAFVNWDVIINGVTVDNFTVNEGFLGTISESAGFASIAGPNYTVELRVTNEVAGGQGSHTLRYAGSGFHQIDLTDGGCVLGVESAARVRAGKKLRVDLDIRHNRSRTVTVPFFVWVEDMRGNVITSGSTRPITLHQGDRLTKGIRLRIPEGVPAGSYRVFASIDQMRQGRAQAVGSFRIVE